MNQVDGCEICGLVTEPTTSMNIPQKGRHLFFCSNQALVLGSLSGCWFKPAWVLASKDCGSMWGYDQYHFILTSFCLCFYFFFNAMFSFLLGQMKSEVRGVLDLIQLDGFPGFCPFLLVSCHLNFMVLSLFLETTFLGIIFSAVFVLYAGTDCICSSKMLVLHNFHHFYGLTFCHFLLEFGCGLLCFDSGLSYSCE